MLGHLFEGNPVDEGTKRRGLMRVIKNSFASAGDEKDMGSIPGSGRSPGGGHGNLLLYSDLENPMDRGAW